MEALLVIILLCLLLAAAAAGLVYAEPLIYPSGTKETLIDRVDDQLPQTQCGKCGYEGCRPYAKAIVEGRADINQCPPGGDHTIQQMALLLGRDSKPLNTNYGYEPPPQVAVIDEELCIGCRKCIPACPVDAIIGAAKVMHTVIPDQCTGCELCIEPCPVDCISLESSASGSGKSNWPKPDGVGEQRQ